VSLQFRVIGSGSSGNTTLVEAGDTRILLDAGLGPREMTERLQSLGVDPGSIAAIFVSHEHGDHAGGAAALSRKWGVRLAGTRGTYAAAGFGAEEIAGYDVLEPRLPRQVGCLSVLGFPVPHDAAGPIAFVVSHEDVSLGHGTDFGHLNRGMVEAFRGCDAILVESNYDPGMLRESSYPWSLKERILGPRGHLSNEDVARYVTGGLGEACRTLVLAHLSQNNNHPELARMCAEAALRRRGRTEVRLVVTGPQGTDWIDVRPPDRPGLKGPTQLRLF
jgi:phosphoribosyl 1,2-cyclic phosphodiesterase